MATCFADDSIRPDELVHQQRRRPRPRQTRGMAGRGEHAVHRLSQPAVRIDGDRALVELPLLIEWCIHIDGVEADLASACPRSTAQRGTDGLWRIARITSIYEKDTLVPVLPGTRLAVDPAELAGYRPSYRFLAWYLNRKGYTVGDHHLGDDQPDAVAGQYRIEHTWLHHSPTLATPADPRKEQHS
jgi:hypothetical protein